MKSFFSELKRRNVVKVAIAYAVVAWVIMQVVDIIQDPLSLPEWFQKVVIVFLAIGFPVALIISWAFELTPQGLKKTEEVDKQKSIAPRTGQKINKLIVSGLALAVAFLLVDRFMLAPPGEGPGSPIGEARAGQVSIAVLPFVNMSPNPEQEYFSDGITEEILNTLVKVKGLQVAARTSAFSFKGVNRDVREIGRELDVDTIVEGSVRRSGDDLRITAQLIRVSDGMHLWSGTFDRKFENVFAIQEEIAVAISDAVKVPLGLGEGALVASRMENMAAYDRYLQARRLIRTRGEGLLEAITLLETVVSDEPGFAPAWASLATALVTLPGYYGEFEGKPIVPAEIQSRAEIAAIKAISLDPNLAEARHAYANALRERRNFALAEDQYKIAYDLDPNSIEILEDFGELYFTLFFFDRALGLVEEAVALEPDSPLALAAYGDDLVRVGRYEEAVAAQEKALAISPTFTWAGSSLVETYLYTGQARRLLAHLEANGGYWEKYLRTAAKPPMDFEPLRAKVRGEEVSLPEDWNGADWYPFYGYYIGGPEVFLDALQSVEFSGRFSVLGYNFEGMDRIRATERFKAMVLNRGLVDYWRERGWPKYCWPLGEYDFQCGAAKNE